MDDVTTPQIPSQPTTENYWIKYLDEPWQTVTKQEYLRIERSAGFHGSVPGEPACASFGGHLVRGSTFTPAEMHNE